MCYQYARLTLSNVYAGAVGALAGFQAVQASSEAHLLRLLADRATAILAAAKHLNWLPDQPPRTALGHSAYIQDLLPFLKVRPLSRTPSILCCGPLLPLSECLLAVCTYPLTSKPFPFRLFACCCFQMLLVGEPNSQQ